MTPTITRCGNGEFLLKFVHEGRTMMTWVLTRADAQDLWLLLDDALDEEME